MIANKWPALVGLLMFLFILMILLGPACQLAPIEPVGPDVTKMISIGDELGYFESLSQKPRASTADGARIAWLLLGEYPWNKSLDEIKTYLLERKIVKKHWEISEAAPLTRGKLAFMMCYTADIKTSMIMQLTRPFERLALREAVFHELMVASSTYRYVSGQYLLDVASRTEAWMEEAEEAASD